MAASGSVGMSSVSAPASSARTQASPELKPLAMPPISSASVTTSPLKPSCLRSRSGEDRRARAWRGHRAAQGAGTAMCAVMTASTPASIAALKGTSSRRSRRSRSAGMVAQVHVRIDGGVAVAGEVLGGGEREILLVGVRALDEGHHVRGDGLRVLAEGADVDDRIVGVVVDVGDRVVDPVDAEGAGLARRDLALVAREWRDRRRRRTPWRGGRRWCRPARMEAPRSKSPPTIRGTVREPLHLVQERGDLVGLGLLDRPPVGPRCPG